MEELSHEHVMLEPQFCFTVPPVNVCDPGAINKSGQAGSNCWTDDAAAFWRVNSTSPYKHVGGGGFGIGRTRQGLLNFTRGMIVGHIHSISHMYLELKVIIRTMFGLSDVIIIITKARHPRIVNQSPARARPFAFSAETYTSYTSNILRFCAAALVVRDCVVVESMDGGGIGRVGGRGP